MDKHATAPKPYAPADVGQRLRIARQVAFPGLSQEEVAREFNVSDGAWSKWERGENRISDHVVYILRTKYGIESGWLIWNDETLLSLRQREAIDKAAAEIADMPQRGRKAKAR